MSSSMKAKSAMDIQLQNAKEIVDFFQSGWLFFMPVDDALWVCDFKLLINWGKASDVPCGLLNKQLWLEHECKDDCPHYRCAKCGITADPLDGHRCERCGFRFCAKNADIVTCGLSYRTETLKPSSAVRDIEAMKYLSQKKESVYLRKVERIVREETVTRLQNSSGYPKKGSIVVNRYIDLIEGKYPGCEYYYNVRNKGIYCYQDDVVVAAVMPLRED